MRIVIQTVGSFAVLFAVLFAGSIALCQAAVIHVPADQPTIQAGIDAAVDGDTVLVADGTYTGDGNRDISFKGKTITVRSENGPDTCIIDCEGIIGDPHQGFSFYNDEGPDSRLSGFTIMNGLGSFGAGIRISSASPTIDDCIITGNTGGRGGGISLFESHSLIAACIISDNLVFDDESPAAEDVYGGGVYTIGGSPVFVNCLIVNNTAEQWLYVTREPNGVAGGIYARPATLIDCVIAGNTANKADGGGSFDSGSSLINCAITGNTANKRGGGGSFGSGSSLINCTITGNTGAEGIGGGWFEIGTSLTRCIAWNNTPDSITGNPTVTYSDVQGGFTGEGNFDSDPLFVTGPDGDYYLRRTDTGQAADSPCVDAGEVPASSVCFETTGGTRCLSEYTTRTDRVYDFGMADLGFHYHGPGCEELGIALVMDSTHLEPLDHMSLAIDTCNPGTEIIQTRIYVVLEVYGLFFFRPAWSPAPEYELCSLSPGLTTTMLFDFVWPETGTTGNATFIALLTNETGTAAMGTWGLAGFDWE